MDPTKPRLNPGKFVVALILLLATAIAAASIWLAHQQMRQVIPAMTAPITQLIVNAPAVEVLKVARSHDAATGATETIPIDGQPYQILDRHLIDPASEITRIRRWLVRDDNYDWTGSAADSAPAAWQYILTFADGSNKVSLAIDADAHHVYVLPAGPTLSSRPMSENLRHFLSDQFAGSSGN
jgi:hypothetical protein